VKQLTRRVQLAQETTLSGETITIEPERTLLIVMRVDCPTCELVLPIVSALAEQPAAPGVAIVCQSSAEEARRFTGSRHRAPIIVDDDLRISRGLAVEGVPAWYAVCAAGEVDEIMVGWNRADFEELLQRLSVPLGRFKAALEAMPSFRPGCGSRTIELEAPDDPIELSARLLEIPVGVDEFEFFFDVGLTDGLPVVPPTEERVRAMLTGTLIPAGVSVGKVPPSYAAATVEKIAIAAVMAGCKPAYLPTVIAAVEAICDESFNLHGVLATTFNAAPLLIVNGPVRNRIGMNARGNILGQGNRANATIGRAAQLLVWNLGGGRPTEVDMATHGQPGKFTSCFAELEEESPWPSLSVERGFPANISTVSSFAVEGPRLITDDHARSAEQLSVSFAECLLAVQHPRIAGLEAVVIVSPQHAQIFADDGWTKEQVRMAVWQQTKQPLDAYLPDDDCAEGTPPDMLESWRDDQGLVAKFQTPESLILVVAGARAGAVSSVLGAWWPGAEGSIPATKRVRIA